MDALTSMATVAGYKAVLVAADRLDKMFPLLMTAAGTVAPASVLVLGAGVAGLQAIAAAKRLGASVLAFDARPAVREQDQSVGASFLEMDLSENVETAGGYANEASAAFLQREQQTIAEHLPEIDIVISSAKVFGKAASVLITAEMVDRLRPGAVIVDLAADQGGNCELTKAGQEIERRGLFIIGADNLPAQVPADASQLYAHNVVNLFRYLHPRTGHAPDDTDEIVRGACVTRDGEIVNAAVRGVAQQGAPA
jgi:NAD(P) transhydrogenase subunit alpha